MKNQYKIENRKEKREKNKLTSQNPLPFLRHGWRCINAALLIALFSLFICNCDLFTKPKDPEYLKKIDEEIAWANATKLNITVAYPNEWGSSPQFSGCYDAVRTKEKPRSGYPFNVEFTPNSGFGFISWLAFEFSEDLRLDAIKDLEFQDAQNLALKAEAVKISPSTESLTGAYISSITVVSGKTITLVPFCSERPYITQSNPPLINNSYSYTRGQEIRIWMNLGYALDTELDFGEGFITVFGQNISDGSLWDGTGDLQAYYEKPVYEALSKNISIKPNSTLPNEEHYPPGYLTITITVGTDLLAANGKGMSSPVSFSYRTSNEIVTRAYKANNVWAIHDPEKDRRVESFFYQTAPSDRDRRLRKNPVQDYYDVSLYFSVSRSIGEIEDPEPDSLTIAQIYYADLKGKEPAESDMGMGVWVKEVPYAIEPMENTANSAGSNYRLMNTQTNPLGVYYYKAVYRFTQDTANGIIRLAILPWRDTGNLGAAVPADDWQTAIAEGSFVTVVLDDQAPGGGSLQLSGQSYKSIEENIDIYNYTVYDRYLSMSLDFSGLEDNFLTGGRLLSEANPNIPWTMDDQKNLFWQWSIIPGTLESSWLPMGTIVQPVNVSGLGLSSTRIWDINVQFKDNAGNESEPASMGKIRYTVPKSSLPITDWELAYSEEFGIQLLWNTPANMDGVEITFKNPSHADVIIPVDGTGLKILQIDTVTGGLTEIDASRIKDGIASEVTKYIVEFRTYKGSISAEEDMVSAEIWNIPNMANSESDPVEKINMANAQEKFTAIRNSGLGSANKGKRYLLEEDITLSGTWIPIGSGSGNNAFQGNFYGNGKTITLYGGFETGLANNGFFGYVENAVIRDLVVEYAETFTANAVSDVYAGGIAGYAVGNTTISNCILQGVTLQTNSSPAASHVWIGGIAGRITGSVRMSNCLSTINVQVDKQKNTGSVYAGGAVGCADGLAGTSVLTISDVSASGNITVSQATQKIHAGGVLGSHNDTGLVRKLTYSGTITIERCISAGGGEMDIFAGGIAGWTQQTSFEDCKFEAPGKIIVGSESTPNNTLSSNIGGIIGKYQRGANTQLLNCTASGDITVHSIGYVRVGGIAGYLNAGASDTSTANDLLSVTRCTYEDGTIFSSDIGLDISFVGGFVGQTSTYTVFDDCQAKAAKIEAAKTGSFYVGGFAGNFCIDKKGSVSDPVITVKNCQSNTHEIIVNMTGAEAIMAGGFAGEFRYSTIPVTNCSSASPITVNAPNTTQCWVGGFAGYSSAKLENCESTEAVDATSSGTLIVGGLVGYSTSAITGCTAKGAVKAVGSGTYLSAGGLAGESVAAITDCYAKGGIVDAYANGGILRAGGLLGCGTTSSASISSSSTAAMSASAALDEYTHATGYVKAVNDGNGNTQTNGEIRAGGLVGYTQGSIDKCYAAGEVYAKSGARHAVGGLVGGALYTSSGGTDTQDTMGTIKNSWANGKVTAIGGVNEHFAGGLVGRTTAAITSCYATGDVDGSETGTVSIALRVGGLVGYAVSRPNPPINATIENCYATGNVKAVTGATSLWAGGLVGRTETSISGSSHATGKVESKNTAYDHFAGGLAGEVVGQINTCDATGELEAENNSNDLYAGGLVGLVTGSIQNSSTDINVKANGSGPNQYVGGLAGEIRGSNITLCSAEGNLDITGTNLRGGGLVGQNTASNTAPSTITQSWSKGNVTAAVNTSSSIGGLLGSSNGTPVSMTQCFSTGFVNIESIGGSVNAGGLAGYFRGNIERSGAKGDVTVTQNEDIVTTINAGGLVGRLNEAGKNITNCYTLGDVTVDYNYSQYAHMAAGGIVGRINGNTVQNSFSAGKVEIKSNTTYAARGGGIIGTFEGGSNSIQRTVALGERITATAGSAVPQDRINAYRISYWNSSSMTFNLNYALEDILIGTRTDGYGFAPATSTATGGTASNENGADVSDATRKTDTFWTGTMGFSSTIWDTAGVNIRGYPVLKDVEGQE